MTPQAANQRRADAMAEATSKASAAAAVLDDFLTAADASLVGAAMPSAQMNHYEQTRDAVRLVLDATTDPIRLHQTALERIDEAGGSDDNDWPPCSCRSGVAHFRSRGDAGTYSALCTELVKRAANRGGEQQRRAAQAHPSTRRPCPRFVPPPRSRRCAPSSTGSDSTAPPDRARPHEIQAACPARQYDTPTGGNMRRVRRPRNPRPRPAASRRGRAARGPARRPATSPRGLRRLPRRRAMPSVRTHPPTSDRDGQARRLRRAHRPRARPTGTTAGPAWREGCAARHTPQVCRRLPVRGLHEGAPRLHAQATATVGRRG